MGKKAKIAKNIGLTSVKLVVSSGVGYVVGNAISTVLPSESKIVGKVLGYIGTAAICSMTSDYTETWITKKFHKAGLIDDDEDENIIDCDIVDE